jgi:iron complex outermembrane receptor protein
MTVFSAGNRGAAIGLLLTTTAICGTANAQSTIAPPDTGTQVNEIVVTATRRETRLQDTPVAVSVVGGEAIRQQRLVNLVDIAAKAPSITFDQSSPSESFISIRGTTIGNDAAGIDQGVSVFIDDVPTTGFGDDSPDLYDLQSIEILRGPQGTLFGRNVTGGAVLIRTRPPSFQFSGQGTITYGSDNLFEAQSYITGPLVADKLAGKISFNIRRRDNYITNTALNNKTNGEDIASVRGQLLWTPTANFALTIGADYLDDTSQDKVQYLLGNFQPSLYPPLAYGPNATNQGIVPSLDKKVGGGLVRAVWTLPFATLTSITGYRNVRTSTHFSTSGDPFNNIISDPKVRDDQFTEEVRLTSPGDPRFTWTVGAFFLHGRRAYLQTVAFDATPGTFLQFLGAHGNPCCLPYAAPFVRYSNQHVTVDDEAVFGEATYAFTRTLKLALGGRFSSESKAGHTEVFDTSGVDPALASGPYAKRWNSFTPKALLSFEPASNFLAYVSATNGYESGGYDTNATNNAGLASPYNPERVWSYEAGAKTQWFDRRLTLNGALYDAEYSDLQTRNFDPITNTIVAGNAARARVRGLEVEAHWIATDYLTLGATYSYTDAKYRRYVTSSGDFTGNNIPFTPRNALNVNGELHFRSPAAGGQIRIGGDVTYRSKIAFDDANDTARYVVDQSGYHGVANLWAIWQSEGDRLEVSVWAKNLTNSQSVINASDLSHFYDTIPEFFSGKSVYITNWTPSRTVGVSLTGKF